MKNRTKLLNHLEKLFASTNVRAYTEDGGEEYANTNVSIRDSILKITEEYTASRNEKMLRLDGGYQLMLQLLNAGVPMRVMTTYDLLYILSVF